MKLINGNLEIVDNGGKFLMGRKLAIEYDKDKLKRRRELFEHVKRKFCLGLLTAAIRTMRPYRLSSDKQLLEKHLSSCGMSIYKPVK